MKFLYTPTIAAALLTVFAVCSGSLDAASADGVSGSSTSPGVSASPPPDPMAATSFPVSADPKYQIRPGDVISVSVYNEIALSQPGVRVLPGGLIQEPLVGAIHVGGMTPAEASAAIERALTKYVRHPSVTVALSSVAPVDVFIFGNVKTPGRYQLQPASRLLDALGAAGGPGPVDGDLPDAVVSSGGHVDTISLQKLLHDNDLSLDRPIVGQTTIYVTSPTVFNVDVTGAVDRNGDVAMHEGDRLVNAIARAGVSPNANADLNHVVVSHRLPDGTDTSQTVNMYDIYRKGDASKDLVLVKGDRVFVPAGARHNSSDVSNPLTTILFGLMHI